jgi:hypothetical protein
MYLKASLTPTGEYFLQSHKKQNMTISNPSAMGSAMNKA